MKVKLMIKGEEPLLLIHPAKEAPERERVYLDGIKETLKRTQLRVC